MKTLARALLADVVPNLLSGYGRHVVPYPKLAAPLQQINEFGKAYQRNRSRLDPIELELSDEFQELDLMQRAGWTIERARPAWQKLRRILPYAASIRTAA